MSTHHENSALVDIANKLLVKKAGCCRCSWRTVNLEEYNVSDIL